MTKQEKVFRASTREKTLLTSLFKKDGNITKNFKNAIMRATFIENKIYHTRTTGSGRFITTQNDSVYFDRILNLAGYKVTKGNDAPRGGQAGNYYQVSRTAIEFILNLQ